MTLAPRLNGGTYAFAHVPNAADLALVDVVATMREDEGLTVVLAAEAAERLGLEIVMPVAWITLTAETELSAVGITAGFSRALADAGIACNVIAGVHHDHVFVPVEQAERAVSILGAIGSV